MNEQDLIRRAMSALGKRKSKAKAAASRANGAKNTARKGWPKGKKRPKRGS